MSESVLNDAQRGTKLGLTAKQVDIAIVLADPSDTRTISDMCIEENVPRRTFYNWVDKPEFLEFVNSLIDKYTDTELAGVWKALSRKARAGDTQAIKLFFEMKGKYRETKDININPLGNLSDEERSHRINELMVKVAKDELMDKVAKKSE